MRMYLGIACWLLVIGLIGGVLGETSLQAAEESSSTMELRGGIANCRIKFMKEKKGRVAYLGGSITTMTGWRDLTYDLLKNRFPETDFDFINAGIGGTNSTLGAFRFEGDIFKNGPVDLLFLEFAVNDGGGDSPSNRRVRAMEGIVRQARRLNPQIDIVMQYFATQGYVDEINRGIVPSAIVEHEKVARHYDLPILNEALVVTQKINAQEFGWEKFSHDSCHPQPFGHDLYAQCIDRFFDAAWEKPLDENARSVDYPLPEALDARNYEHGRFVDSQEAKIITGWKFVSGWVTEKTCNYGGPVDVLTAEHPGDELQLTFEGSLLGFSAIAGFDAGILEYRVDGGESRTLDLFDHYCTQFHRPVCHILAEELSTGKHVLTLKMKEEKNPQSTGTACRILQWIVN